MNIGTAVMEYKLQLQLITR